MFFEETNYTKLPPSPKYLQHFSARGQDEFERTKKCPSFFPPSKLFQRVQSNAFPHFIAVLAASWGQARFLFCSMTLAFFSPLRTN